MSIVCEVSWSKWKERGVLPYPQRPFEHLHQTEKVSALDFAIDLAHDPHIVVISFAS